uniref:Uncharacterized protein n=1 Tax=Catagonus wagneri TaxID=51154 RepID=A0A8C3YPQ1_9CETA
MQYLGFLLLARLTLLALTDAVDKKKDKVNRGSPGSKCVEWTWGPAPPAARTAKKKKGNARERVSGTFYSI